MDNLLKESLDPLKHFETEYLLVQHLSTPPGISELHNLLTQNNNLAFIFLKNITKKLLDQKNKEAPPSATNSLPASTAALEMLTGSPAAYLKLISTTTNINFNMLVSFFETLSLHSYLDINFYINIRNILDEGIKEDSKITPRVLKVLGGCFKKYEALSRSNRLYSEINENVNLFGEYVVYFLTNNLHKLEILDIYYFLIFQDIHAYFEEKNEVITNALYSLMEINTHKSSNIEERLCDIINLYLTKYTEHVNLTLVYNLITHILIFKDTEDISIKESCILHSLIKRKQISLLQNNLQDLLMILYKLCHSEMEDSLLYTRNTAESDPYRGNVSEMILIVDSMFTGINYQVVGFKEGEPHLFFCTVLPDKFGAELQNYLLNIHSLDEFCLFTALRYLLKKEICLVKIDFLIERIILKDFSFYKIIQYFNFMIERSQPANCNYLGNVNKNCEANLSLIFNNNLLNSIILIKSKEKDDEFTSQLIFNIIFYQDSVCGNNFEISDSLFNYIYHSLINYEIMTSYFSTFYMIDSLCSCIARGRFLNESFSIPCKIIKQQSSELFPLAIQMLAVLILNNLFDNFIQTVFSDEKLWAMKENWTSLTLLGISLYRKDKANRQVLENLCCFLVEKDPFCAYLVLGNLRYSSPGDHFDFVMKIVEKKILYDELLCVVSRIDIDVQKLEAVVFKCIDELMKTLVAKRSVERVKRALDVLENRVGSSVRLKIAELRKRNEKRKGSSQVLKTVLQCFDL